MVLKIRTFEFELLGTSPMLQNNGSIAPNPLHSITKLKKEYTAKRKKTDNDLLMISLIEWYQGLYLDEPHELELTQDLEGIEAINFTGGEATVLPGRVIKAALVDAGKKSRLGTEFKQSVRFSIDTQLLLEDAPTDPNELVRDSRYIDIRPVVVQRARIMKARPIFSHWKVKGQFKIFSEKLQPETVIDHLDLAGQIIGLCDYRPSCGGEYGCFDIIDIKEIDKKTRKKKVA